MTHKSNQGKNFRESKEKKKVKHFFISRGRNDLPCKIHCHSSMSIWYKHATGTCIYVFCSLLNMNLLMSLKYKSSVRLLMIPVSEEIMTKLKEIKQFFTFFFIPCSLRNLSLFVKVKPDSLQNVLYINWLDTCTSISTNGVRKSIVPATTEPSKCFKCESTRT